LPQFFGQHLMFYWGLTPAIPVHTMRLASSNTDWCQMDNGTASNQYNFGQLYALLGQADRLNADVLYTFASTPAWAAGGSYPQPSVTNQCASSSTTLAPADESYWTNFVTALVTAAHGRIHAYELWNEVDYAAFWTGGMAAMVRMSIDAAAIIHRLDPSALVLSPSITNTPEGYAFLRDYLSQLPPGTIDAVAIHTYFRGAPEDAIPAELATVRSELPAADANLPIWSTEGSWGQNQNFSMTPTDQRAFVARYDLMLLAQHVQRSYWYAYTNGAWGTLQSGSWDSGTLTPAGVASGTVYAWLADATLEGCASSDGNFWTCDLTTSDGKQARVVWATKWAVWYPTNGYTTVKTLDGQSSSAPAWIQVLSEPVMLSS
jgi:hypothetical protein